MNKLFASLVLTVTTALAALLLAPTSADAARTPPCAPANISPAEFSQLHVNQSAADVWQIVGAWGSRVKDPNPRLQVFSWGRCTDKGAVVEQRIAFYSLGVSDWYVAEIR